MGGDLNNLHIMTVGGKVYASEHGARDTEAARILCGGHGMDTKYYLPPDIKRR